MARGRSRTRALTSPSSFAWRAAGGLHGGCRPNPSSSSAWVHRCREPPGDSGRPLREARAAVPVEERDGRTHSPSRSHDASLVPRPRCACLGARRCSGQHAWVGSTTIGKLCHRILQAQRVALLRELAGHLYARLRRGVGRVEQFRRRRLVEILPPQLSQTRAGTPRINAGCPTALPASRGLLANEVDRALALSNTSPRLGSTQRARVWRLNPPPPGAGSLSDASRPRAGGRCAGGAARAGCECPRRGAAAREWCRPTLAAGCAPGPAPRSRRRRGRRR